MNSYRRMSVVFVILGFIAPLWKQGIAMAVANACNTDDGGQLKCFDTCKDNPDTMVTVPQAVQQFNTFIRRKTHVPVEDENKVITDLEVLENGDVVAARENCIQLLDRQLKLKHEFSWPNGETGGAKMAARTHDNNIAVCGIGSNEVYIFDFNGKYLRSIQNGLLNVQLRGVRMNSRGELVLIDDRVVWHIDYNTGDVLTPTMSGLFQIPARVTTNSKDIIIVTDLEAHCIMAINRAGEVQFKYGSRGSGEQELMRPAGVCCDQHNNIIIADCDNNRVTLLTATGQFIKHLLTAQDGLDHPMAVAIDSAGHLLVGTVGGDIYTVQYLPLQYNT